MRPDKIFKTLYSLNPGRIKSGLDGTVAFSNRNGNPENSFSSVHIAGTNGKGSTALMIYRALRASGIKAGIYTSPHVFDFRERAEYNGENIELAFIEDFCSEHLGYAFESGLTFFEFTTIMCFCWFRTKKAEVVVCETGMGGRWDSTNILTPLISVITRVSFDHTEFLGNSLEKIASEKAGIIKKGIPVIAADSNPPEVLEIFRKRARLLGSDFKTAGNGSFRSPEYTPTSVSAFFKAPEYFRGCISVGAAGSHQLVNLACALFSLDFLRTEDYSLNKEEILKEFKKRAVPF
ncbi:MAG: bifunctional folylpolyglutamate synthase/dihydrofolate synthase, partial [Fibrobacterota bacterium]